MSVFEDLQYELDELKEKLFSLERERGNIPKSLTPFKRNEKAAARAHGRAWVPMPLYGVHLGVCVETRDPWKMGRIMVYCPVIHNLKNKIDNLSESSLTWASPCSSFGAIDDVGATFVPPEGSAVVLIFENGHRDSIYYLGSTWVPKKSSPGNDSYAFNPQREGHRWGTSRDGDVNIGLKQSLLPPWNNESYYGNDLKPEGSLSIIASDTQNIPVNSSLNESRSGESGGDYSTEGWRSRDIPHMYGIKTPEKHFILFDDGSYERENKLWGKRLVVQSSKSNIMIMKDDCDQTAEEIYEHIYWDSKNDKLSAGGSAFSKIGNKHSVELNHTGVQLQSFGGGRLIIDDKIKGDLRENQNKWDITFPPQPKGGQKLYRTMVRLESHTEHRITLSDHHETSPNVRSKKDGIFLSSACGHYMGMIDHTDEGGKADKERKIHIKSTSGHEIILKDYQCSIASPIVRSTGRYEGTGQRGYRDEGVYDEPKFKPDGKGLAEKVCLKIKSGFGHFLLFEDGSRQNKVTEQHLRLSNAPGWNDPHNFLDMKQPENKLVWLRCAGERLTTVEYNYTRITENNETLISKFGNQIHVVQTKNMVDVILKRNYINFVKLGNHIVFVRQGRHLTYALQQTAHMCLLSPHIILGDVPPEGDRPPRDGAAPVLLLGGSSPLPATPAKWLIAN